MNSIGNRHAKNVRESRFEEQSATHVPSQKAKRRRKPKELRRKYKFVEQEKRKSLETAVLDEGLSIAKAARLLEVNYEAAKQILRDVKRKRLCGAQETPKEETDGEGSHSHPIGLSGQNSVGMLKRYELESTF